MSEPPAHRCLVIPSPITGLFGTAIESARGYGRHTHATFGFGVMERGAQRSWSGRGSVEAFAGDVITTNPGEVHDGHPLGEGTRRWRMLYVEPSVMAAWARDVDGRHDAQIELTRPVVHDAALTRAICAVLDRLGAWAEVDRETATAEALACEEALAVASALLVGRCVAERAEEGAIDPSIRRVRDRLADSLLAPPSLAELASSSGTSKFRLLRHFERAYGLPPHAWLVQQRVERARRLIISGSSLADAAADAGFADQSHMNRHFVRHLGFTPGAWGHATMRR